MIRSPSKLSKRDLSAQASKMSLLRQSVHLVRSLATNTARQGDDLCWSVGRAVQAQSACMPKFSTGGSVGSYDLACIKTAGCTCSSCASVSQTCTHSPCINPGCQCRQIRHATLYTSSRSINKLTRGFATQATEGKESVDQKQDQSTATSENTEKTNPEESVESAEEATSNGNEQLKELEAKQAELSEQVDKLTDQLKRSMAEMENVRKRAARDVDTAKKFAVQSFVKSILDVADNLERAAGSVPAEALVEGEGALDADQLRKLIKGLIEGVAVTEKVLLQVFKQQGVEQYNPVGEKFDPNLHNALFEVPDASKEVGTIAAVTKRGYKMHDRVVRPADVGVVKQI